MSFELTSSKISVEYLGPEHNHIFQQALNSLLSTNLAELTFSQIIDGLPLAGVWGMYGNQRRDDINDHETLCPQATEIWTAFKANFQSHMFQLDSKLVQGYQNQEPGTKNFNVRLLEMIAVAFHDLAALLYKNFEGGVGTHGPKPPPPIIQGVPSSRPTDFYHGGYKNWEDYPQGVADMVGYWAEFEIFGGVVVFDRGESDTECLNAFIHPGQRHMIFQVSDAQLQALAGLGSGNTEQYSNQSSLPIPFKADRYARRVDENESMALHIYRDKYERKSRAYKPGDHPRWLSDDPVMLDVMDKIKANNGKWPS